MPWVNPGNPFVGPQALRRKKRLRGFATRVGEYDLADSTGALLVELVRYPRQRRWQGFYRLEPPTVVTPATQPPVVTQGQAHFAAQRPRRTTISALELPVRVSAPPAPRATAELAASKRPRSVQYKLSPPQVVNAAAAAPLAPPLETKLARSKGPQPVRARLQPPQAVNPDNVPGDGKRTLQTNLVPRAQQGAFRYVSKLGKPQVVAPDSVLGDGKRQIAAHFAAKQPPRLRNATYRLAPPQVVAPQGGPPVVTQAQVHFAAQKPRRRTVSSLGAPVIVGAFVPPPSDPVVTKLRVTLAKQPPLGYGRFRKSGYSLAGPAVVNLQPAETSLRLHFAAKQQRRPVQYHLGRPQVLATATAPVVTAPKITLAQRPRQIRPVLHRLGPPQVVSAPPPPLVTTIMSSLTQRPQQMRPVQHRLGAPTAVNAPTVVTRLRTMMGVGQ